MCPAATTLIARIKDQFKTVEDMETIFKKMDLNCNGKLTKQEMIKAGNFNEQEVDAVFDLGDVDCDGEIDLNEFIGVMQTAAPQAYSQAGEDIEIGKVGVYKVGSGPKCVIWCHDCKGGQSVLSHQLLPMCRLWRSRPNPSVGGQARLHWSDGRRPRSLPWQAGETSSSLKTCH